MRCLGVEVFGFWDPDCLETVRAAARARCEGLSPHTRLGTNLRLLCRWFGMLSIAVQQAVAHSILSGVAADVSTDLLDPQLFVGDLPKQ